MRKEKDQLLRPLDRRLAIPEGPRPPRCRLALFTCGWVGVRAYHPLQRIAGYGRSTLDESCMGCRYVDSWHALRFEPATSK